jgi:NADH-quinone oxidoreductase subunit N
MAVFLFSLVGLPPFAGFIGKLYLFQAVLAREMYGFALFAALNSVISLYYYVKIVRAMFLEKAELKLPEGKTPFDSKAAMVFLTLLAVPNVVLGLYWEPVMRLASMATDIFVGK